MKRPTIGIVGAVIASVALVIALQAQERQVRQSTPSQTPAATQDSPAPQENGKVVFTFSDDEQMEQFAQLWQQRQAAITRLAVLQAYANQEQSTVRRINDELLAQYNLDVNKEYALDPDERVLVEREPAEGAQAPAPLPDASE